MYCISFEYSLLCIACGREIKDYEEWEEVTKGMNGLPMSGLMGADNRMILCPQKSRFFFHFASVQLPPFEVLQANLFFFFVEIKGLN